MINQLYTFTVGSYVVADEWNANFKALANSNTDCVQAIEDAEVSIAFPDDDLTQLFNAVRKKPDSEGFTSTEQSITLNITAGKEYYGTLTGTQDLFLSIPTNMNGECRVVIKTQDDRDLPPVVVSESYTGKKIITGLDRVKFKAGTWFLFIVEQNGTLIIKTIRHGE